MIPKHQNHIPYNVCVGLETKALPFTHGHRKLGPCKKDRTSYFPVRPSNPVDKSLMLYNSNFDHPSQFYPRVSESFFAVRSKTQSSRKT